MGGKPVYLVSTGFIFVHYRYRPVSFPPPKSRLTSQTSLALRCFGAPFWPFFSYLGGVRGGAQPPLGHNRYQPVSFFYQCFIFHTREVHYTVWHVNYTVAWLMHTRKCVMLHTPLHAHPRHVQAQVCNCAHWQPRPAG